MHHHTKRQHHEQARKRHRQEAKQHAREMAKKPKDKFPVWLLGLGVGTMILAIVAAAMIG